MQLIQDLIDELRKANCRIEDALIQAQMLAHKLGDQDMAAWVASELKGYPDRDAIPPYREIHMEITGNVTNGHWSHKSQPLVLSKLRPEMREWLPTSRRYRVHHLENAWPRFPSDVPPVLSSGLIWSPIPQPKEIGREEAFYRRADHRLPA
jgi:hypothetical protein